MKKEEFEKWFYRVIDSGLHFSLEPWQISRVKELAKKAIKKGKSLK